MSAAPSPSPATLTSGRPTTVLIGALGGEGGGVLSGWVVDAAQAAGHWVQATSVPGVAQRTGATTYYVEIGGRRDGGESPVMALLPSPGNVDLLVASELLEAGRAAQNGMITRERTTVIASTHRFFAIAEKSAMGDGRFDTDRIVRTVDAVAARRVFGDLGELARAADAVVSSVLFGAMAASEVLPFDREAMEDAIRRGGIAVEANLRGFAAGFEFARARLAGDPAPSPDPAAPSPPPASADARVAALPAGLREIVSHGVERTRGYQGEGYAERYLSRVEEMLGREQANGRSGGAPVTTEVARYLALWMTYEDVIRVADLKTRRSRYERVRGEVRAGEVLPVVITEFLKPGVEEWCSLLPRFLAGPVMRLAERTGLRDRLNFGMHVKTTSVSGFLLLWSLARLRWWRPYSSRFHQEQARIERWLGAVARSLAIEPGLAEEVARLANLVKGYGETHARGTGNFERIMGELDACAAAPRPAEALRGLREAALADPEGKSLGGALQTLAAGRSGG